MTQYSLYRRLGEPQGWYGWVRKISPPPGFNSWTVQPVASHYTDYAIPAHSSCYKQGKYYMCQAVSQGTVAKITGQAHFIVFAVEDA